VQIGTGTGHGLSDPTRLPDLLVIHSL
jgi:hypothetical protein